MYTAVLEERAPVLAWCYGLGLGLGSAFGAGEGFNVDDDGPFSPRSRPFPWVKTETLSEGTLAGGPPII